MNHIFKWAGGKRKLIPEVLALYPSDYEKRIYHEPFLGGGAIFFQVKPKKGTINDVNPRLMNFYSVVRDNPEKLIEVTSRPANFNIAISPHRISLFPNATATLKNRIPKNTLPTIPTTFFPPAFPSPTPS